MSRPLKSGLVIIGRNEGDRLRMCFDSLAGQRRPMVYVDSGSADASVALARSRGIEVLELDRSAPFTAARARNTGFSAILERHPELDAVQFLDGDCELAPGWLEAAEPQLAAREDLAAVVGRNRERERDRSVYNLLCDIEWDTPIGEARDMGGIALMRAAAFRAVGGFNAAIIAAEDTDLALRLREAGWKILRIDADMTTHDAAIYRLSQWWIRAMRSGHAFANMKALHGGPPFHHGVRQSRSALFWGLGLPAASLALAVPTLGFSMLAWLGYGALYGRIYRSTVARGIAPRDARAYAFFTVISKFPEAVGQLKYWRHRVRGRESGIIEYKQS